MKSPDSDAVGAFFVRLSLPATSQTVNIFFIIVLRFQPTFAKNH